MTAEEAMIIIDDIRKRARLAYYRASNRAHKLGGEAAYNAGITAHNRLFAATLIHAQIEALDAVRQPAEQYIEQEVGCLKDELAKLEGRDA